MVVDLVGIGEGGGDDSDVSFIEKGWAAPRYGLGNGSEKGEVGEEV